MSQSEPVRIPAGHGKAVRLGAGAKVKLINTYGTQVVDCWALNAYDLNEFMSMESTRATNVRLNPLLGDTFVTNQRRPIITLIEDTTPGVHDTFMAACDRYRYGLLGFEGYHRNCQDNLIEGLQELGVTLPFSIAGSWNIFMNIPVLDDRNSVDFRPTQCKPGQFVVLQAKMDCYVAFSTCPQDILPIHGEGGAPPKDCHFQVV
jgi:uncharacterized protein YcgI (DUF1989 family)